MADRIGAKKRDYWWTVLFTDPLAAPIVRLLARKRWLTPNQVSIIALVMGLLVGPVFSLGTRAALAVGGLLFYVTFIVDCVDGKLARALGITTTRGAALDRISDGGRRASSSLGLIVWLWRAEGISDTAIWWGIVYVITAYYFLELSGVEKPIEKMMRPPKEDQSAPGRPGGWSASLAKWRLLPTPGMPDVQAIVFILGPITGAVVPALALGTVMVGSGLLISAWRRLRVD